MCTHTHQGWHLSSSTKSYNTRSYKTLWTSSCSFPEMLKRKGVICRLGQGCRDMNNGVLLLRNGWREGVKGAKWQQDLAPPTSRNTAFEPTKGEHNGLPVTGRCVQTSERLTSAAYMLAFLGHGVCLWRLGCLAKVGVLSKAWLSLPRPCSPGLLLFLVSVPTARCLACVRMFLIGFSKMHFWHWFGYIISYSVIKQICCQTKDQCYCNVLLDGLNRVLFNSY